MLFCWAVFLFCATTQALNFSLRLEGGPGGYAGRIEVKYNGTWGAVCDDGFDINVGHVICRQLGYPEAIAIPCCSAFGAGRGPFWLADVKCQGNESSLFDCDYGKLGHIYNNCDHYRTLDDASVVCRAPNASISYPPTLRLAYTPVPYAGCVQVKNAGVWGDVGQFHWNRKNSRVVCRELGYQDVVTVLWRCSATLKFNYFTVTWMDNVRCHGNESSLINCTHRWQTSRGAMGRDAGVFCTNGTEKDFRIRLKPGNVTYAGRLEVLLAGMWGAIDRYTWEFPDAQVACRQLGFTGAFLAVRGATYVLSPKGVKAMGFQWLENVKCLGNESKLNECVHDVSFTPGPVLEAGVICNSSNLVTDIRLADGNVSYAGRVEVQMAGIWGTVRNQGWNLIASNVVCRQLGYRGAEAAILNSVERFGKGEGPVWISGLKCEGHEESLLNCSWPKIAGIYWDHDNDAGVECIPNTENTTLETALNFSLRLDGGPGGYAGRIEVKYNGTWGSVCDDGFDINVGHVICRQRGYPEAIAIPCCSAFGEGRGTFWLAGVKCQGNESSLFDCKLGGWGYNNGCGRYDAASVVCRAPNVSSSYPLSLRLAYTPVSYAGCVQVNYAGVWGDVGQFYWNRKNGRVVCRELGYQNVLTVLWRCSATFNKSYYFVTWMDNVRCYGNESSLSNCTYRRQTFRGALGIDAGVVCSNETVQDFRIRLKPDNVTYAGRLEVLLAGMWGAIDRYTWEFPDAQVACRQLGFTGAFLAVRGATYVLSPKGVKAMGFQWLENVKCLGNESKLNECVHDVSFTPGPVLEAGVICNSSNLVTDIRLAGGNVSYAGRVEVQIAGIWGTVRNRGWNLTASNVVCRQLGYQGAEAAVLNSVERFGKGEGPVWISGLKCEGHEESLLNCSWLKIAGIYWDHDNDASVECIPSSISTTLETGFPSSAASEGGKPTKNLAIVIALPIIAAVALLILIVAVYARFYRQRRGEFDPSKDLVHLGEVRSFTDAGVSNPGFLENNVPSPVALEFKADNVIDWCEIAKERLSLGGRIESELTGVRFRGKLSLENGNTTDCIVKTTKDVLERKSVSDDDENDLLTELRIMSCLGSHPNILNMFGACTLKGPTYLVFEDAEHASLLNYLQQNSKKNTNSCTGTECTLTNVEKLRIALDVVKGMRHLAQRKCVHKDLAARNVCLDKSRVAKITNIGSTGHIDDRTFYQDISSGKLSAAKWMAPETLESMIFSSQSDIWSFGVLLWEIETGGAPPYPEIESIDLLQSLKSGYRLKKPNGCSDVIYEVMTKCWQGNPSERPKFSELRMVLDTLVTRETSC